MSNWNIDDTTIEAPMKLPSISQAVAGARSTFMRFPLVVLVAIAGTVSGLILIDHQGASEPTVLIQIVFGAVLGFPLLTGLAITSGKWKLGEVISFGVQLAGIILVGLYAVSVPRDLTGAPSIHSIRLFMLFAGTVLFGFAAPYFRHESELGYWNYCKILCLRVLTAGLYTFVLWGGLAIALAALDNLFGVHIPERRYGELVVFLGGIFAPWFFLAGVPNDLEPLDTMTDYPKGLKIFSQYILFPLVLVYLVILYAYLGKILFAWDWPQGWVSRLILGFIATGFASLLLLHPIRDRIENAWITTASRWFYVVIIPLTIMLLCAVGQRVSEYGITEGRYLGYATVAWLCVVTPYFILSRKKKIIFLTASLCVAVFVVSFGPWGMFAVSERSQVNRLKDLLEKNHILVDGRVQNTHDSLHIETTREISSIIGYLSEIHGFDAIQPWFGESLKRDSIGRGDTYKEPAIVAQLMGVAYVRMWHVAGGIVILRADRDGALDIDGYTRLLPRRNISIWDTNRSIAGPGIEFHIGKDICTMTVTVSGDTNAVDTLQIDLQPLVDTLTAEYGNTSTEKIPPEKMVVIASSRTATIKTFLPFLRVKRHDGKADVESFDVEIAYKNR
jgi:hypothetical protein